MSELKSGETGEPTAATRVLSFVSDSTNYGLSAPDAELLAEKPEVSMKLPKISDAKTVR